MLKKWKVKSDIIKDLIYSENEARNPAFDFIFKNKDPIIRVRDKSRGEKIMESVKMLTLNTVKWAKSIKKGKEKAKDAEKDLDKEIEEKNKKEKGKEKDKDKEKSENEKERVRFRRQISFTFRKEFLSEFISVMQALKFKDLGGFEHFGRRDADYSMAVDVDEKNRLHIRVFIIADLVFVLAHYEPKATEDIGLHVKGFFDRALQESEKKNETEKNSKTNDEGAPMDEYGRAELSDYILGSQILLDVLESRVPNFYQKVSSKIGKEELNLWMDAMGPIDHLPPEVLLPETLFDCSLYVPAFENIRRVVQHIFEIFDFEITIAWDIKIPPKDNYFLAKSTYSQIDFQILVLSMDFDREILRIFGSLNAKYKPQHILIIVPDYQIDGPGENYEPPEEFDYKFDKNEVDHLLTFLKDRKVCIIKVTDFIYLFKQHFKHAFRHSDFSSLFENYGLISKTHIEQIIQRRKEKTFLIENAITVFRMIKEEEKPISIKQLFKKIKNSEYEISSNEMTKIIAIMENPLIGLIEPINEDREKYKIRDTDEDVIEEKLNKFRKTLEKLLLV